MALPEEATKPEPVPPNNVACPDCEQSYKTPQGLAGHRRLKHSTSTARALDERSRELDAQRGGLASKSAEITRREAAARKRETEIARRKQEIEETGPSSIGLSRCDDCGAWFDAAEKLEAHEETTHPIDGKVATEVGVSKGRVNDVWTEACNKQKRHSDESPEQIVKRFWSGADQKILRSLLDHNALFKFEGEE